MQPDHDVSFNATIREALEALERIPGRFAARYDRVDMQLASARRKAEVLGKSACEQALSGATLALQYMSRSGSYLIVERKNIMTKWK